MSGRRTGEVQCRESAAAIATFEMKCRAELRRASAHARESPARAFGLIGIEADAIVGDSDHGKLVASLDRYRDGAWARVLHRVIERLLHDAKHAERHLRAQLFELLQRVHVPLEPDAQRSKARLEPIAKIPEELHETLVVHVEGIDDEPQVLQRFLDALRDYRGIRCLAFGEPQ